MKGLTYFLFFYLMTNLLFCQNNLSFSSESSIIQFQATSRSNPVLHLGGMQTESDGIRLMTGMQFQPTKNLLIGGVLSPHKAPTKLSIYYHIAIGYIPKTKLLHIFSSMLQIGMHSNRFDNDNDTRWFSFSIMEKARFGQLNLNFSWNHLFNEEWENVLYRICYDRPRLKPRVSDISKFFSYIKDDIFSEDYFDVFS